MSVRLRQITIKDLQMIMDWRMSPEVSKYMYTDPKLTLYSQDNWFKKISANKEVEKYWIIQLGDGMDVGLLSITNIDYMNKQACWAYYLGNVDARGKGLARILECNIYNYVFNNLKLNKLWCEVFEFNESVIKIHEKFGAKIEGKLIAHIYKNGEYYNVIRMATFKSDWINLSEETEYENLKIDSY